MSIGKAYSYLFYKLYKFWEWASTPKFWSDWKAALTVDILEIILIISIVFQYSNFTKRPIDFGDWKLTILMYIVIIALPNYFFFNHRDQWRGMIKEFDQWPERKNKIGSIIVGAVVVVIVANLVLAFYFMSQIDWQHL